MGQMAAGLGGIDGVADDEDARDGEAEARMVNPGLYPTLGLRFDTGKHQGDNPRYGSADQAFNWEMSAYTALGRDTHQEQGPG